ncbi:glyoxylate/hydroxypyruvate reductase A [Ramlibacter henchirensis]|uniref:Glyoxylate/hydroxypyruvate reductase A n=1 Tax=Ramlibacter henchirensis TaxID=204072 RepID=A0A4Z0C5A2_9BURK|nr:glyoxylate/hydroxypyruvate reductase A [Ramlibacter henchirensis]TFZ05630.1 glyoxylate/hydroxypyruvate reductase A [Ramlibacter henchirensis]
MAFVYKGEPRRGAIWAAQFAQKMPQLAFRTWPDIGDASQVRFLAAWQPPERIAEALPNLEILFSVGAGVDQFDLSGLPGQLRVVRMVEPGLVTCMTEYVAWAALSLHREAPLYLRQQRGSEWKEHPVRPASTRRVGVMGMGTLGRAALAQLRQLGFDCAGWNRSRRNEPGVRCYAGKAELKEFLARTDILVCLLPLTAETRGILERRVFDALPEGAALINAGRGGHLVEADLLAALDGGRLSAAILDVCEPEPLPRGHAFWDHPRIWLTPHVASATQAESAADALLDNLRRHEAGLPLEGLVDRSRGY